MMEKYDEDLQENPFFGRLLAMFPSLYEDAPHHKWVICVPRLGSYSEETCCEDDFQCHILQPLDISNPGSAYCTLNGKVANIEGNKIFPKGEDDIEPVSIPILFEEVFYNSIGENFKVLCVEGSLQGNTNEVVERELHSLAECIGFLKREIANLYQIDTLLAKSTVLLRHNKHKSLDVYKKSAMQLYQQALQLALQDPKLDKKKLVDNVYKKNLHIAVETYVHHNIYSIVMQDLKILCAKQDVELNTRISSLYDIRPKDLEIKAQFCEAIPRSKIEIRKLAGQTTPLGKFGCLQRTFNCIKRKSSANSSLVELETTFTTDDVLSLLVYLVLNAGIGNWHAHLMYMQNFCFFMGMDTEIGEHGFHLATLEASVQHIKCGIIFKQITLEGFSDSQQFDDNTTPLFPKEKELLSVKAFFEFVRDGEVEKIEDMLRPVQKLTDDGSLCHPLCTCDKCAHKTKLPLYKSCLILRDNRGNTALHLAVTCGHEQIMQILLKSGDADVNASNSYGQTPLHIACYKGHQNIELLLLDKGADLNAADNEGNVPLHCAVNNGHISCVKTLLFCNEHALIKFNVNATNHAGDTALHLASRWGYDGIVELLRQFGAIVGIKNKKRQNARDCAHNKEISKLLKRMRIKPTPVVPQPRKISNIESSPVKQVAEPLPQARSVRNDESKAALEFHHEKRSKHYSSEQKKRMEKLLKAVTHNDLKLVCFYLGLPTDDLTDVDSSDLPQDLCHPLCQCEKCRPVQEAASTLYRHSLISGLSINCYNDQGITPLHEACVYGHLSMIDLFIRSGAFVNAKDFKGSTPLHLACQHNRRQVVDILLKNEALLNMVDLAGNSPLHNSCNHGTTDVANLLIQNGADVNQANYIGNTALHDASSNGNENLVTLLLSNGAIVNIFNRKGETCLDLAKDPNIILLLKSHRRSTPPACSKNGSA